MYVLYIDESGDTGSLPPTVSPGGNDQPVLVLGGIIAPSTGLGGLTHDFLKLKAKFFPVLSKRGHLNVMLGEVKGSDLRKNAMKGSRNERRHAIGFFDNILNLVESYGLQIVGRVWIKKPGEKVKSDSIYTFSVQHILACFDSYLAEKNCMGFCVADSRSPALNANVSHSVFTQKFGVPAKYRRIIELPSFGHSQNFAGLQLADTILSGLIYPIACWAYCRTFVANKHVHANAQMLRLRYGTRLRNLQYRCEHQPGKYWGGITVSDPVGQQNGGRLFSN